MTETRRRNPHCSNCGDTRGGPIGHEISECTFRRPPGSTPLQRLGRIADAHRKDVDEHGGTFGLCVECGWAHPCPTYVWATTDRDLNATWDPRDDEPADQSGESSR